MQSSSNIVTPDPWEKLQQFTEARIALGRSGVSLPLKECLQFKLAHARARDAVHKPVDISKIVSDLEASGQEVVRLKSSVSDRAEYLKRPDKGRILSEDSRALLANVKRGHDVCLIICDGLSAPAVNESAAAVCNGLLELISQTSLTAAPVFLVENGRVAIGDEIAGCIEARMAVTLIGERPGLSSPNSLGAYLTHSPRPGKTDEARNCISNIRSGGMSIAQAVQKIAYLIEFGFKLGETGVRLKDNMSSNYIPLLSYKNET